MKDSRHHKVANAVGHALAAAGIARDFPVLAGISGGLDSMVLLDALRAVGQSTIVVHLDHRLRGRESTADAAFVAARCAPMPCVCGRSDVAKLAARENLSIEAAGRFARRALFARAARKYKTCHLLLAHHADDQAETVMWNLLRGSGLAGAAGMAGESWQDFPGGTRVQVIRPLLGLRRKELESHARSHALAWREDASNADPGFTRNRLRHQVFPVLDAATGRDTITALARFADIAREDNRMLDQMAVEALASLHRDHGTLDLAGMRALPMALRRRVLILWIVSRPLPVPAYDDITRALAVIDGSARPARANLPGNFHLARREKRIWLEGPDGNPAR